jgi:glycerol-3-phosphate dehydrogenase
MNPKDSFLFGSIFIDAEKEKDMYDVVIIGAGVSGCAVARELSRYQVNVCVVDKCEDVCCGTSKANSAIVHAGFDAESGSLMAKLNVEGNAMMDALSKELDFPFRRNGSMVVCTSEDELDGLKVLYDRGVKNGVPNLKILNREEAHKMEPNLADDVCGALYAPTGGIVCPFNMTIALAENAFENGAEFRFDTEVTGIVKEDGSYTLKTDKGDIEARYVVNAAGVYADDFHNMVSAKKIHITPRRGDYCLLDHTAGTHVDKTVFALPTKYGKGVLVTPTIHGNLLVGPTAIDIEDKEGVNTTREGLDELTQRASLSVKNIPMRQVITSFAGLRAHEDGHEFIIGEAEDAKQFIDVAGIESPGLSSAPAIGVMVADLLRDLMHLEKKADFKATRKGILNPSELSLEERNKLIKENPAYGTIICRCEMVTEGEIIDSIRRPLGARSLDGIKRRTRAGMGRCQAGFCSPRSMEILERELSMKQEDITKAGGASKIVVGRTKEQ